MRHLLLFSGIESCSATWQPLGWTCVGFSEIDPFCCALLSHHYPDIPNLGDIRYITEDDIKNLGTINLIVFGSPCQDLSVAGNRAGLQGERSGLFKKAMQLIAWAKKHNGLRFALWENVQGAFSSNKGRDFAHVVGQMAGLSKACVPKGGFKNTGVALGNNLLEWRVLDAQYFGVPQRRKRVFALADFGAWQDRPPILLECQSVLGDTKASRDQKQSPAATTCCVAHPSSPSPQLPTCYGVIADITPKVNNNLVGTLRATGGSGITPPLVAYQAAQSPPCRSVYAFDARQSFGSQKNVAYTLCATDHKAPQAVYAIAGNIINRSLKAGANGVGVQANTSYTLTTVDRHAVNDLMGVVRRLTPIECERLMGFCDDYTQIPYRGKDATQCPKSQRYKALGNSMAVPVMRWIGEQMAWALTCQKQEGVCE